ncbi:OstA-like protein [Paraflavisolibacter sp. H34]|uniref:OstA-like protein n=1 Tax=Huijunlia imazamoxiresistens TaxID=3127457 RepID=UPI003019B461
MKLKLFFLFLFLTCLFSSPLFAQLTGAPADSTVPVEILHPTGKMSFRKINDTTTVQILSGSVRLRQGSTLFYADSCVINQSANRFEAFGHVHINDSDTAHVYSNYLRYHTNTRLAHLQGAVKLSDGQATLTTDELDYDMLSRIGTYTKGGKVVNKKSVLTSREGIYYADLRDVYFKKDVVLNDPAYHLTTDSLLYNTELQTTRFIAETFIRDSSGRTIRTSEGSYDLRGGRAQFTKRTTIVDKGLTVTGDEIADDDSSGIVQVRGRGVVKDTAKGISILANEIFVNKHNEAFLATVKPLMIIKQQNDSIYITADTLFSARLSDLHRPHQLTIAERDALDSAAAAEKAVPDTMEEAVSDTTLSAPTRPDSATVAADSVLALRPVTDTAALSDTARARVGQLRATGLGKPTVEGPSDTLRRKPGIPVARRRADPKTPDPKAGAAKTPAAKPVARTPAAKSDTSNRYFEAFRHVRVFSDSVQAVSDSLFYSFRDSTFQLFQGPVVWSNGSQITGDTIFLRTRNRKADRVKVFENSFMVNEVQKGIFNQIKSTRLDGYFHEGLIDSVRANGYAESVYFIQDEDSAFSGVNQTQSDILDAYFANGELSRIVFRRSVKGSLYPIKQRQPAETLLKDFQWLEERRPKTKYELFE